MSVYSVPEVSPELVADVAKTLAQSSKRLALKDIAKSYDGQYSKEYVRRAVNAGAELKYCFYENGVWSINDEDRNDLKKSTKDELNLSFRKKIQNYAPFLLYIDYISKHYTSEEASMRMRGILDINTSYQKIDKTLKSWGKYSDILYEENSEIRIKIDTDKLLTSYVEKLVASLEAEIRAKIFTIDMIGPEVFAYLDKNNIGLEDITQALRNYEVDPRTSAGRSCDSFEAFMHSICGSNNVQFNKQKPSLMDYLTGLRGQSNLPSNLLLACQGIVGIRNMTHHNPDSEIRQQWKITQQSALTTTLLVPILIKSVYQYNLNKNPEF